MTSGSAWLAPLVRAVEPVDFAATASLAREEASPLGSENDRRYLEVASPTPVALGGKIDTP